MKKVLSGHTLSDALEAVIKDPDLKEAYFTTPMALRASMPEAQPNKFLRYNNKGGSGSFSGKQFAPFTKGKGKGSKGKSKGKPADPRLKGLSLAWRTPDNVNFVLLGMQGIVMAVAAEFISAESKVAMPATRRWIMPRPLLDRTAVRPHPAKLRKLFLGMIPRCSK